MGKMKQLVEMSNRYGANEQYVLAGGGNTSCKENGVLFVKASGTSLATIKESGFVRMQMPALLSMLQKTYPENDAQRETAALSDMMAALEAGQDGLRPSVECLLHALFPQNFVLHLHPALVNGLTCGKNGRGLCENLLGEEAIWVALTKPGYVLAKTASNALASFKAKNGKDAQILIMQNHGLMVAANTVSEIDEIMQKIMSALSAQIKEKPNFEDVLPSEAAQQIAPALRMLYSNGEGNAIVVHCANKQVMNFAQSKQAMQPLLMPFSPDQIVYCKASPLFLQTGADVAKEFEGFIKENAYAPKIVVVQDVGFFALGKTKKEAEIAKLVFLDAIKVVVYAKSFGGELALDKDFTNFILNWEIESYRQKAAFAGEVAKRMQGKICIVTGGAQGFGEGIAQHLAQEGAYVVVADMNEKGAKEAAQNLCKQHGANIAIGVGVNVADEASVKNMVFETVLNFGGLDVMVSCAGILIAGGLQALSKESFEKVTAVNYTGYFLCAKYSSVPMKIQHEFANNYRMDIIEINSKSGLEGSKNNFAYAGSKFGGIGLTQSFALELASDGIKVNAICPGNLLDGPLWSDPEKGLFRQYLDTGKVPGAKTVADVRKFYEDKVPLGRGCTVKDVAKAVFYISEQEYETGQAMPVTGGQTMLN